MERAVFYARVSTEEEKQLNALSKQVEECRDCIRAQGWALVGEYVDEGKSGTKVRGRDEYRRLFEDLEEDRFDIIVIKSQDRLMRNVKDWYIFLDRMLTNGKRLFMYIDNSFYTSDNALITGIKAILAEEYSRELSKKLKNVQRRRIEKAKAGEKVKVLCANLTLGYEYKDDEVVINEKEAEIVRYVFSRYLQGVSYRNLAIELEEKGWRNRVGNPYEPTNIQMILKNERYKGIYVMNRRVVDFDKKKNYTTPESEWVRVEGLIPPIVSPEVWDQAEALRLSKVHNGRGVKLGKSIFSGKCYCGECGKKYHAGNHKSGRRFMCSTYVRYGSKRENGCKGRSVYERDLLKAVQELSEAFVSPDYSCIEKSLRKWLKGISESLRGSQRVSEYEVEIIRQEKRKDKLTEAYMDGIISKDDYKKKYCEIENLISELSEKIRDASSSQEISEIEEVLNNFEDEFKGYLDSEDFSQKRTEYLTEHIQKIIINPDSLRIELDLMGGVMLTGKDFYLFVHERSASFVQTEHFKIDLRIAA